MLKKAFTTNNSLATECVGSEMSNWPKKSRQFPFIVFPTDKFQPQFAFCFFICFFGNQLLVSRLVCISSHRPQPKFSFKKLFN